MIGWKDISLALAMVSALGLGEAVRPREEVQLARSDDLGQIIPSRFGDWRAIGDEGIVRPQIEGEFAQELYSSQLPRTYVNSAGEQVMLLVAYGRMQSDAMQLHRPEACYPAVGFALSETSAIALNAGRASVPAMALTARRGERIEDIVYWTRLGEYLPQSTLEQRRAQLATAMQGRISDGVLVRASTIRSRGNDSRQELLTRFLADLILATGEQDRPGLVGSSRAEALADSGTL